MLKFVQNLPQEPFLIETVQRKLVFCEKNASNAIENILVLLPGSASGADANNFDPAQTHNLILKDRNNLLKTAPSESNPEHSSVIVALGKGKSKNVLRVWRVYNALSEKNSMTNFDLPLGTFHTIVQFCTEYVAISMQNDVLIYNVMAKCKVESIKMTGMF